jgi:hypothetical protein
MAYEPGPHDVTPSDAATKAFVQGLVDRGEAVEPPADGKLPPGATHIIVGRTEEGLPIVRRMRFSGG